MTHQMLLSVPQKINTKNSVGKLLMVTRVRYLPHNTMPSYGCQRGFWPFFESKKFFDDIFSEHRFYRFFQVLYIRKVREFFSDDFYDKKIDFTIKKQIFYERGAGNWNLE